MEDDLLSQDIFFRSERKDGVEVLIPLPQSQQSIILSILKQRASMSAISLGGVYADVGALAFMFPVQSDKSPEVIDAEVVMVENEHPTPADILLHILVLRKGKSIDIRRLRWISHDLAFANVPQKFPISSLLILNFGERRMLLETLQRKYNIKGECVIQKLDEYTCVFNGFSDDIGLLVGYVPDDINEPRFKELLGQYISLGIYTISALKKVLLRPELLASIGEDMIEVSYEMIDAYERAILNNISRQ